MSVEELAAFADQALAGLEHRCIDFDLVGAAEPLRAGFEAMGWKAERLVWMRHEAQLPPGPEIMVEEVPYGAVDNLRVAWGLEDFPGLDQGDYPAHAREISLGRGAQVLAVREDRAPVAFAQLERYGGAAEITHVYVHPEYRGAGRGTAMTRAAVEAAGDVRDLWITADDEDRPKELLRAAWLSPGLGDDGVPTAAFEWRSLRWQRLASGEDGAPLLLSRESRRNSQSVRPLKSDRWPDSFLATTHG